MQLFDQVVAAQISLRVSPSHDSIGNRHLASLVTLDPLWSGEIMLAIRELYALDQPLGKPLLRDGFTLVSSAIDDEELASTLLPDTTGSSLLLIKSTLDTKSVKCPIFLIVRGWHKDRAGCILLGSHLLKEA